MVLNGFDNDCTVLLQDVNDMLPRAGIFLLRNTVSALCMNQACHQALYIKPNSRVPIVDCISYKIAYDDQLAGDNCALGFVK
jgi:hypothetical protein